MADELGEALRNQDLAVERGGCIREKQFRELYQVLGKREEHDRIRDTNRETKHCRWLMESPNACDCLPRDLGESKKGSFCPNNPYERERALFEALQDQAELLQAAYYVGDLIELGRLPAELSPAEFTTARMMRQRARVQEMSMRAMSMFGA